MGGQYGCRGLQSEGVLQCLVVSSRAEYGPGTGIALRANGVGIGVVVIQQEMWAWRARNCRQALVLRRRPVPRSLPLFHGSADEAIEQAAARRVRIFVSPLYHARSSLGFDSKRDQMVAERVHGKQAAGSSVTDKRSQVRSGQDDEPSCSMYRACQCPRRLGRRWAQVGETTATDPGRREPWQRASGER